MRTALLIGFSYANGVETKLPGVSIDLYLMYRLAQNSKADNILVVTDIDKDEDNQLLTEAIVSEIADLDLYNFISRLTTQDGYISYRSKQQLQEVIVQACQSDQLFLYYSGHGAEDSFILPSLEKLGTCWIVDTIRCCRVCQSLIVLDCCNASIDLPYKLAGRYRLRSRNFVRPNILCLAASQQGESSYASGRGSTFTRSLVRALGAGCLVDKGRRRSHRNLNHLVQRITSEYKGSTVNVYSSHPNINNMYSWLYGKTMEVVVDGCCVRIKRNI